MTEELTPRLEYLGKQLPATLRTAWVNLGQHQRDVFVEDYARRRRSTVAMVVLAVLFPIQFFFLRKAGLGIAYLLTGGFFVIGWIVFWFVTPSMVHEYNREIASQIVRDIRYAEGT
ncbi:hypothetical protein [Candidatus Poriferisodalis sp.]|uniref:hypothetical protein n=1 Tax=Candidatus Poriferisodalis sp. TaxID=3101277 RepID=UPI003B529B98